MYQALYRKYRPKDFNSVVGQDSIIKTLKNSVKNGNFSHAYMFFGPRGTGKTSISKIFARNINCLSPVDGDACKSCVHCLTSFSKDCIDIIEIDAASNNGVDEIRDLKNKISLVPSSLKYKVYIIDEVHMLSIGAFNALLKTLEEPPEHAIFILATTDPQKVPETIISRCQCFSFRRISSEVIEKRLRYVCDEEKIKIDDDVLKNISIISDGGLRDALGSLDKLISYTDELITMDVFTEINGIVLDSELSSMLGYILDGKIKELLNLLNFFDVNGKNLIQIFVQLLNYSRNLLVDFYLNDLKSNFDMDKLQLFCNLINEKINDIKKSSNPKIYIELLLLKFINDFVLINFNSINKIVNSNNNCVEDNFEKCNNDQIIKKEYSSNEIYTDINTNEEKKLICDDDNCDNSFENSNFDEPNTNILKIINIDEIMNIRVNNTLAKANKVLLKNELLNFDLLKDYSFDQEIGFIVCSLLDGKIRAVSDESIILSYEYDSNVKQNLMIIERINEVYNKITNSNKSIAIISDSIWENEKNKYINNIKSNISYKILKEPDIIYEDLGKNDILSNSAVDLFGDIVEIE